MLTRTMVVLAAIGLASGVRGELKTFDADGAATGDFHTAANWDPPGVPDADDRIIILGGKTCNVNADAEVDTLEIQSDGNGDGKLFIKSDVTLTLDNDDHNCPSPGPGCPSAPQHSIIDGDLSIVGDATGGDATLEIVNATHEFSGQGSIIGSQGPDISHIVIGTDLKLVNKLGSTGDGIHGGMTITGLTGGTNRGILRNEGNVFSAAFVVPGADDDELVIDAAIEDDSSALWGTDCGSLIEFKHGSLVLQGLFSDSRVNIDGGEFRFNADIRTCGNYERDGCGGIDIVGSVFFQYDGFTGTCSNPGSGPTEILPNSCSSDDEFYEISADVAADCE